MADTPLLGITELTPSQTGKETTINNAILALESATNASLAVSFAAGNVTLSVAQFSRNFIFRCSGQTADRICNVPAQINGVNTSRVFCAQNDSATWNLTVQVTGGAGDSVTVPPESSFLLQVDGNGNVLLVQNEGGGLTFEALSDGPGDYTGNGDSLIKVKNDESGLEFIDNSINSFLDVDTVTAPPSNGDALIWNSGGAKWEPGAAGGGGGGSSEPWYWAPPTPADYTLYSYDNTKMPTCVADGDIGTVFSYNEPSKNLDDGKMALKAAPVGWTSVEMKAFTEVPNGDFNTAGIMLFNSGNNRVITFGALRSGPNLISSKFNFISNGGAAASTWSSNTFAAANVITNSVHWKLVLNGTNLEFYWSNTGKHWQRIGSTEALATFLVAVTHIGFGMFPNVTDANNTPKLVIERFVINT